MSIFFSGFVIFFILLLVLFIITFISKSSYMDREKSSPFECGFDPISSSRIPFSLHFFLMGVIFLIFDVEIVLILPITIISNYSILFDWLISSMVFMFILLGGLYHEWSQGMLDWSK